jgi:hypothetical protein
MFCKREHGMLAHCVPRIRRRRGSWQTPGRLRFSHRDARVIFEGMA